MTEQEAQAYVKRLEMVWKSEDGFEMELESSGDYVFQGRLSSRCILFVNPSSHIVFSLYHETPQGSEPVMGFQHNMVECRIVQAPSQKKFAEEYLSLFRRGCFLMGCPIEASAHEKAEWIQGFSTEELQAWNLKM